MGIEEQPGCLVNSLVVEARNRIWQKRMGTKMKRGRLIFIRSLAITLLNDTSQFGRGLADTLSVRRSESGEIVPDSF